MLPIIAIAAAAWVTTASVIENIYFARATGQLLQLIAAAHELAARDKNFATQPDEDLIDDLIRAGLVIGAIEGKPAPLSNPWKGAITSISPSPSAMRIETDVPDHDCRRMALFFIKNSGDLGLRMIEARGGDGQAWQRFYSPADGIAISGNKAIENACEQSPRVTLALVLALH